MAGILKLFKSSYGNLMAQQKDGKLLLATCYPWTALFKWQKVSSAFVFVICWYVSCSSNMWLLLGLQVYLVYFIGCSFPNIGIQCCKRHDVEESLKTREKIRVDPFGSKSLQCCIQFYFYSVYAYILLSCFIHLNLQGMFDFRKRTLLLFSFT